MANMMNDHLSHTEEVSLIHRYGAHYSDFKNSATPPPKSFDKNQFNVFLRVLGNPEHSQDCREWSGYIICRLLHHDKLLAHSIVEKGAFEILIPPNAPDANSDGLLNWGILIVNFLFEHCVDCVECRDKVYCSSKLFQSMAHRIASNATLAALGIYDLIYHCHRILLDGKIPACKETGRVLLTGIDQAMVRFSDDDDIRLVCLETLNDLAYMENKENQEHTNKACNSAYVDAMLNNTKLMENALAALRSANPLVVRAALLLMGAIATSTYKGAKQLIQMDGFMKSLTDCLDSASAEVRLEAVRTLFDCTCTRWADDDVIPEDFVFIVLLIQQLHSKDAEVLKEVYTVFVTIFHWLTRRRVLSMNDLMGTGVREIVRLAIKWGADPSHIKMFREIPVVLKSRPEFYTIAEESFTGWWNTMMIQCKNRTSRIVKRVSNAASKMLRGGEKTENMRHTVLEKPHSGK